MRSRRFQAALTDFVQEAASRLQEDLSRGAEVSFELAARSARGHGTPLYCYRPLTGAFIAERQSILCRLGAYGRAAAALEDFDGLDRYLLSRNPSAPPVRGRGRAAAGLRALLEDVFDEQSDFELRSERLAAALARLESSAFASANQLTLVASLHGLTIASPELALTGGLLIAQPDALDGAPPDALSPAWPVTHGEVVRRSSAVAEDGGHLLVVFTTEDPDAQGAVAQGREVMRELLRALRLFGDARVTLGSLAWARLEAGPWSTVALGLGGRPHGMLVVTPEQEDELRAFCSLVSRRSPHGNELAWALDRFEMGCDRVTEYEALSDYVLALRALLEPEGSPGGLLAGRLAALCATPDRRVELTERIVQALALERSVIAGTALEHAGGLELVRDLANHLRALLRDVVCGHLDPDLTVLADELLAPRDQLAQKTARDTSKPRKVANVSV